MHARTPGTCDHNWLRIHISDVVFTSCHKCDLWILTPLAFDGPEIDDKGANEGESNTGGHSDNEELLRAVERDRKQFYTQPLA